MIKKILSVFCALCLMCAAAVPAYAAEIDTDRNGHLTFELFFDGKALDGGSLTITHVGNVSEFNGVYSFSPVTSLKGNGIVFSDLTDSSHAEQIAQLVRELNIPCAKAPVKNGKAFFGVQPVGLYLVTQNEDEACEGFLPLRPFYISIPVWQGGEYVYDLTAKPKVAVQAVPQVTPTPTPTPSVTPSPTPGPQATPTPQPLLPDTGQLNWPVPVFAALGIAFFAVGCHMCFGKGGRDET